MSKDLVLSMLEEQGFSFEELGDLGYLFKHEGLNILYMADDDDEEFLRFAVPSIYDVTEENKPFVLEVVNKTNMTIKYSKTCIYDDEVWIFYEQRIFGEEHLEEIIEHCLSLLNVSYYIFHRKIEGDDTLPKDEEEKEQ